MGGSSNKETQLYLIVRACQTLRQEGSETPHAYYERFVEICTAMDSHGCISDPEHIRAKPFIHQLDRAQYGKLQSDLQNLVASGAIGSSPRTVAAAYALAKERVEPSNATLQGKRFSNLVVYSTTSGEHHGKKEAKPRKRKSTKAPASGKPASNASGTHSDLCGETHCVPKTYCSQGGGLLPIRRKHVWI